MAVYLYCADPVLKVAYVLQLVSIYYY